MIMIRKSAAARIVIPAILIVFAGCTPGDRPVGPEGVLTEVAAMTDPEECIDAIVEAYEQYRDPDAVSKYAGALHPDYRFHFQPKDVAPGRRPFLDREEDIIVTGRIFANATLLFLDISDGVWHELCDYEGLPCEGCLTTTRKYFIMAQFGADGKVHRGTDLVVIIAVPDPDFPERFMIRAIYDVDDD
jgi:hypothetical protein